MSPHLRAAPCVLVVVAKGPRLGFCHCHRRAGRRCCKRLGRHVRFAAGRLRSRRFSCHVSSSHGCRLCFSAAGLWCVCFSCSVSRSAALRPQGQLGCLRLRVLRACRQGLSCHRIAGRLQTGCPRCRLGPCAWRLSLLICSGAGRLLSKCFYCQLSPVARWLSLHHALHICAGGLTGDLLHWHVHLQVQYLSFLVRLSTSKLPDRVCMLPSSVLSG